MINRIRYETMYDDQSDIAEVEAASSTYLTFDLGDQRLGVEVRHVREILDLRKITGLPNAPAELLGVVDLRGASMPILDLAARLGLPGGGPTQPGGGLDASGHPVAPGAEARIIVLEIGAGPSEEGGKEVVLEGAVVERAGGGARPLGVLADRVRNVEQIAAGEIEPAPQLGLAGWDAGAIEGLLRRGAELVVLVDLERVLGTRALGAGAGAARAGERRDRPMRQATLLRAGTDGPVSTAADITALVALARELTGLRRSAPQARLGVP